MELARTEERTEREQMHFRRYGPNSNQRIRIQNKTEQKHSGKGNIRSGADLDFTGKKKRKRRILLVIDYHSRLITQQRESQVQTLEG